MDLTPLLPGGDNGGAKVFTLALVQQLAQQLPDCQFVLLTQAASHEELSSLERKNVSRLLVAGVAHATPLRKVLQTFGRLFLPRLPFFLVGMASRLGYRLNGLFKRGLKRPRLRPLGVDLLFCPFTAPTFHEPGLATVSVIYDLQFKALPHFFTADDLAIREWSLREACRHADALIAISDHSRETVIAAGYISPDKIRTIYPRLSGAYAWLPMPDGSSDASATAKSVAVRELTQGPDDIRSGNMKIARNSPLPCPVAAHLNLAIGPYLLYPANFWPHKNHEILLTAFCMACHQGLAEDIRLICTGSPGPRVTALAAAALDMGLGDRVLFPGFLPASDFATLLGNALGLIFPSLYEGFGLPVIEAMVAGVPVACSRICALPEIAGDAALYFDPRVPAQIANALLRLTKDEQLRARLIVAGRFRATEFSDSERMIQEYWSVFRTLLTIAPDVEDA